MKKITTVIITLLVAFSAQAADNPEDDLFMVVTSDDAETQMMAMVLATQTMNQGVGVRILLCSDGGDLALEHTEFPSFAPPDRSPKQLLSGLIDQGAQVEVCGIYLPNREYDETDLIDGVGLADPPEVAEYMRQDNVRYFTF